MVSNDHEKLILVVRCKQHTCSSCHPSSTYFNGVSFPQFYVRLGRMCCVLGRCVCVCERESELGVGEEGKCRGKTQPFL